MPSAETEARFVAPITRENLHRFTTFKVVEGCRLAPDGGVYRLKRDDRSMCPLFAHISGPRPNIADGEVYIDLHQLVGIVGSTRDKSPDAAVLEALDLAERAIVAARAALTAAEG